MELLLSLVAAAGLAAGVVILRSRARARGEEAEGPYDAAEGRRYPHRWGYDDTRFEFCGPRTVRLTGHRYPLAGPPLPELVPFVEETLQVSLEPSLLREPVPPAELPPPVIDEPFLRELDRRLPAGRTSRDDRERLVHSHGQLSVDEIYRILNGGLPERVVDLVVHPEEEAEVVDLVRMADRHGVALVPYGGGTNVTGALLCPREEERMIVSVDMRRMNRILELDRENNRAVLEAGITGKELEERLAEHGFTCGHVPDSIELSTLGGWIATNASGMKKNRYGNIEDIVLEAALVTPTGELTARVATPRNSVGIQPRSLLFGSEGSLGIITRAVVQLHPLPEARRYASFVFPAFEDGIRYLKAVQEAGVRPASIRLTNNTEFRLGQALRPARTPRKAFVARLKKRYVLDVKGFDPWRMAACTVVAEGSREEVRRQEKELTRLAKRFGGLAGGSEGGRRGYALTFAIAYIRDFLIQFGILGETFETSVPWNRIVPMCEAVEAELDRLCAAHGVPGRPYLSYRASQSYQTGVCLYFTMGFWGRGLERPDAVYQEIERRLREVILDQGGSLSHHHGVGKVRRDFMPRVHSENALRALRALKAAVDPGDVFAAGNNVFGLAPDGARRRSASPPGGARPAASSPAPPPSAPATPGPRSSPSPPAPSPPD